MTILWAISYENAMITFERCGIADAIPKCYRCKERLTQPRPAWRKVIEAKLEFLSIGEDDSIQLISKFVQLITSVRLEVE